MNKKGGYIIIDLQSATIVNDLAKALDSNKPVLVYDGDVANFYTLSYDSVSEVYTLTGAKDSYSVDADGVVTDTTKHLYLHIINFGQITDTDNNKSGYIYLSFYSTKSTGYSYDELIEYLESLELNDYNCLPVTGSDDYADVKAISSIDGTDIYTYDNTQTNIIIKKSYCGDYLITKPVLIF